MTEYAPVTPEVVAWAIDESGLSLEDVAGRLKIESTAVGAWVGGTEQPTRGQLTKLAETLKRPRAMFFLPEAPKADSLPDGLRRPAGERARTAQELTFTERLWMRRARYLQEFLALLSHQPCVIPKAYQDEDARDVGKRLSEWLGVTMESRQEWKNPSQSFRGWRDALEAEGVTVLAFPLGEDGVQGFALTDEYAPMIAVNTASNHGARNFTLFHELAHLALGKDQSCSQKNKSGTPERWCEEVASHVLIPRGNLIILAEKEQSKDLGMVGRVARHFKVSWSAAAVALESEGYVPGAYAMVDAQRSSYDKKQKGGGGGGRLSPQKCIDENGSLAVQKILNSLSSGRINELDASDHLRLDRTLLPHVIQLINERSV